MELEKKKVLVVEDEEAIRELIELHLLRSNYQVTSCASGDEAYEKLKTEKFDLAIVDWMIPGMNGVELVRSLQNFHPDRKPRTLMVTAKSEASDQILGLEVGADDYVAKPFDISVLMARVRALLRRAPESKKTEAAVSHEILTLGGISVRTQYHEVKVQGEVVSLTPSEYKLLVALLENRGKVLSRDQLILLVQGDGISVVDRAIDTHIFGLRKKLNACSDLIETVRGVGYRVRWEENQSH